MKMYVVIEIDTYNEDGNAWQRNYSGCKPFATLAEAETYAKEVENGYGQEAEIETLEI